MRDGARFCPGHALISLKSGWLCNWIRVRRGAPYLTPPGRGRKAKCATATMGREMDERAKDDRAERLKAALRDNLKRRKAQARGRAGAEAPRPAEADPPDRPER